MRRRGRRRHAAFRSRVSGADLQPRDVLGGRLTEGIEALPEEDVSLGIGVRASGGGSAGLSDGDHGQRPDQRPDIGQDVASYKVF